MFKDTKNQTYLFQINNNYFSATHTSGASTPTPKQWRNFVRHFSWKIAELPKRFPEQNTWFQLRPKVESFCSNRIFGCLVCYKCSSNKKAENYQHILWIFVVEFLVFYKCSTLISMGNSKSPRGRPGHSLMSSCLPGSASFVELARRYCEVPIHFVEGIMT